MASSNSLNERWEYKSPRPDVGRGSLRFDLGRPPGTWAKIVTLTSGEPAVQIKRYFYQRAEDMSYILNDNGLGKVIEAYKNNLQLSIPETIKLIGVLVLLLQQEGMSDEEIFEKDGPKK